MRPAQWVDGVVKIQNMLERASEAHAKVLVGYLQRLAEITPACDLPVIKGLCQEMFKLNVYPAASENDRGTVTVGLMTPPTIM